MYCVSTVTTINVFLFLLVLGVELTAPKTPTFYLRVGKYGGGA